jgi:hypothetical protein
MKLYSKTEDLFTNITDFQTNTLHLDSCKFEFDDIFYYDRHDLSIRHISFENFIDEVHWNHIRNTSTTKILINFTDDYFNIIDIERFSKTILDKNINPSQVYFLAMDKNFENFARDNFKKFELTAVNVSNYNVLLKKVNLNYVQNLFEDTKIIKNSKKFSSFSRNYFSWRLSLFLRLCKYDNLKYFDYTFHNINPYTNSIFPIEQLKKDTLDLGYELNDNIIEWLSNIPYEIGNVNSKWDVEIYNTMYKNDFHLLIESHLDSYLFKNYLHYKNTYDVEEFSPAFITEKTWKAIACKKPFLMASVPYSLKDLHKLGYKTFSPFIDESYDDVEDDNLRLKLMMNEVDRICNLNDEDYNKLKLECQPIVEYNYNLLKNEYNSDFSEEFNFLKI